MIKSKLNQQSKTFELTVGGKVKEKELQVALNNFKKALDTYDELKVIEIINSFTGIEPRAVWTDLKFGISEYKNINNKVKKFAVVSDKRWVKNLSTLSQPLVKGEVNAFSKEDESKARKWLGRS